MDLRPFDLPREVLLTSLFTQFPCREQQIRALATLLSVSQEDQPRFSLMLNYFIPAILSEAYVT